MIIAGALGALLPTGRAWPRSQRTVQAAVLRALGSAFQRSDNDAQSLITGAFPPTATVMLSEWESSLGLPDDCAIGESGGVSDRQRAVVAKLISTAWPEPRLLHPGGCSSWLYHHYHTVPARYEWHVSMR